MLLKITWTEPDEAFPVRFRTTKAVANYTAHGVHGNLATTFKSSNAHQTAFTFTICHIAAGYSSAKTTRMTSSL